MRISVLFVAAITAAAAAPEQFDVAVSSNVKVAMRDGIKLATDIYQPARNGTAVAEKFPVIVSRSPYNKDGQRTEGTFFAKQGYVYVAQDCRGRFQSEGQFYGFINEGKDGYDTIEWAAAQPWSNGKVGTTGASYLALVQYHAAMYNPPHLEVMFANVGGSVLFDEYIAPGGPPNLAWPLWLLKSAETSKPPGAAQALTDLHASPAQWLRLPAKERLAIFADFPEQRKMYEDSLAHPTLDAYWQQQGFNTALHFKDMKDVPIYFLTGWYDHFVEGVIKNFTALSKLQKTPKKLMVGPWLHSVGSNKLGDADFGAFAILDPKVMALDWFNHWLKQEPYKLISESRVRAFQMEGYDGGRTPENKLRAGGIWLEYQQWPPQRSTTAGLFLSPSGKLIPNALPGVKQLSVIYDPANPVPTIGGRLGNNAQTPNGWQDQVCTSAILGCTTAEPLTKRSDVLSFTSDPLHKPIVIAGAVRVKLWISSSTTDTDFTAKLVDVYPNGYAANILDGQLRTSYRNGPSKQLLMNPRTVYPITIELGNISINLLPRHQIRLDISSSNFPKFEPNSKKAKNTIYIDALHPSRLEFSVTEF